MSQRNNKTKVRRILQTLNKWTRKPSLEYDLSGIIDEYHTLVNNGAHQFSETALFLQSCSSIYEKRVDILAKQFFELSLLLSESCRRPEEEEPKNDLADQNCVENTEVQPSTSQQHTVPEPVKEPEPLKTPEPPKEPEKPPEKKRKRKKKEPENKNLIPGLPKELFADILKSLNLTECNINDVVNECLNKLSPTHPLFSIFAKIGDEISRTKNLITVNDISLTGKAWNILYLLENLLNKYKPLEDTNTKDANKISDENGNIESSAQNVSTASIEYENSNTAVLFPDSGICSVNNPDSEGFEISASCNSITEMEDNNRDDTVARLNVCNETRIPSTVGDVTLVSSNIGSDTLISSNVDDVFVITAKVGDVTVVPAKVGDDTLVPSNVEDSNKDEFLKRKFQIRDIKINIFRLPSNMSFPIKYYNISAEYPKIFKEKFSDLNEVIETNKLVPIKEEPSEAQLKKVIKDRCQIEIKTIKINLFHFPLDLLSRLQYYKLPEEFKKMKRKRQKNMEKCSTYVKKLRSYNLKEFEEFYKSQISLDGEIASERTETTVETTSIVPGPSFVNSEPFDSAISDSQLTVPIGTEGPDSQPAAPISESAGSDSQAAVSVSEPEVLNTEPSATISEFEIPDSQATVSVSQSEVPDSQPNITTNISEDKVPTSESDVPSSQPSVPTLEPPIPDSEPIFSHPLPTETSLLDNRKSIDQRSDMSYSYPVTPDSGHFSLSHIDENEHLDFNSDHEDLRRNSSRADSVLVNSHDENIDSGFSENLEMGDPTLTKLKKMFPNSFSDPTRAEFLKTIVQPPEEQEETESYKEWKSNIDEKTAREKDFNIHECGTEILNSFPNKRKEEKIDFSSVVKGKSVGDISRFFVATLQLANSYNVEICDERAEGDVNSEGFNLKFLSEERAEPELEELNSESMFRASTSSFAHSTPCSSRNKSPVCRKVLKKRRIN